VTETIRIYINSKGLDVPSTSTALEAVAAWDATQADAVRKGERMITDSRGLPADAASTVHNGAIFRVVRARQDAGDTPDPGDTQ